MDMCIIWRKVLGEGRAVDGKGKEKGDGRGGDGVLRKSGNY